MSHGPDMKTEIVLLLWCWTDGEWVPLEKGDAGNIQKDVVSGFKVEMWRLADDQTSHLAGQDHSHAHPGFAFLGEAAFAQSLALFQHKEQAWNHKPFPKKGRVQNKQKPINQVEQVTEVEDLNNNKTSK